MLAHLKISKNCILTDTNPPKTEPMISGEKLCYIEDNSQKKVMAKLHIKARDFLGLDKLKPIFMG